MPLTRDDLQGRLRIGQGINRGAMPHTPPVIPQPLPGIPRIHPTPQAAQTPAPLPAALPQLAPAAMAPPTPRRLPPLSPPGFAIDLTPKGKKADLAGRGAAMLMRGNKAKALVNETFGRDLGPGEKNTLAMLHSPQDLYDPKNAEQLHAVIRPSPVLQRAIDSNPALQHNQQIIQQRLTDVGNGHANGSKQEQVAAQLHALYTRPTPVQQTEPVTSGTGKLAAMTASNSDLMPIAPPEEMARIQQASLGTGVPGLVQKFGTGAADTALGLGPGLVDLAQHPAHIKKIPGAIYGSEKAMVEHPLRMIQNDPFQAFMNTVGMASVIGGGAARIGAVGNALRGGDALGAMGDVEKLGQGAFKRDELRSMARERGISAGGSKTDLHARIVSFDQAQAPGAASRLGSAARGLVWGPRAGAQVIEHNGIRTVVPFYKSALGRAVQRARIGGLTVGGKTIVPGLLDRLDHPNGFLNDTSSKLYKNVPALRSLSNMVSAPGKYGRILGKTGRLKMDQDAAIGTRLLGHHLGPTTPASIFNKTLNRGEDVSALRPSARAGRMTHDQQAAIAPQANNYISLSRGNYAMDKHRELWAHGKDSPAGMRDPVAIKIPTDKPIKASSWDSEGKFASNFENMITRGAQQTAKANPGAVRYVERGMLNAVHPFDPKTIGPVTRGIDNLTGLVRAGRFLHPGYLAWAVQNGILHTSQAGMFALRNAWQLHNHFQQMAPEVKAGMEADVGAGIARATKGESETPFLRKSINALGSFWHNIDDRPFRLMSLYHEMNREGFHTAAEQHALYTDPKYADIRKAIAQRSRDEAIDYSAMTPSERRFLKAAFTAWGWTRGASAFTLRYPLQHPVQAQIANAVGHQGSQLVNQYYAQHGGMPPDWLRASAILDPQSNSPHLLQTGLLNPGETLGRFIGEVPGLTHAQTGNLLSEAAPVPQALIEAAAGKDQYGNTLRGNERITGPLGSLLKRFEPIGALESIDKKGGSTVTGPTAAAEKYAGVPLIQLRNADKTAALGQKDFEQALSAGELINFRAQDHIDRIPQQIAAFKQATGADVPQALIGRYKGAIDTIQHIQDFQHTYAGHHGAKSYKSLPAKNKVDAALTYMQHIGNASMAQEFSQAAAHMTNDKELETLASSMWTVAGQGATQIASAWKSGIIGAGKPKTITPSQ